MQTEPAAAPDQFGHNSTGHSLRSLTLDSSLRLQFGQWSDIRANTVYGLGFATGTLESDFTHGSLTLTLVPAHDRQSPTLIK